MHDLDVPIITAIVAFAGGAWLGWYLVAASAAPLCA